MVFLTVVLRKEVENEAQAETLFNVVKSRMADNPGVAVSGSINITLPKPEAPE